MSVSFRSYVYYGVKIEYDEFKNIVGEDFDWTEPEIRLGEGEDLIGWEADGMNGDWALFGKMVLEGTDNGNDDPLGGDGNVTRLKLLSGDEKLEVDRRIAKELGTEYVKEADYFVVGQYS